MRTTITTLPVDVNVSAARSIVGPVGDDHEQHLFPITDGDSNLIGAVTSRQLADADPDAPVGLDRATAIHDPQQRDAS